jgi:hypothetical protein
MRALALLLSLFALPAGDGVPALAAKATKLFRARKYGQACPLFQQVTALAPDSASAWSDLGVCLGRQGDHVDEALAADRKAIALAGGSQRIRKAAYFNLGKLPNDAGRLRSHIPGPTEDVLRDRQGVTPRCEVFDPAPGCDKAVWSCSSWKGWLDHVRLGLDPRAFIDKKWPAKPDQDPDEPQLVLDGDVIVSRATVWDFAGSRGPCDHLAIECGVVWADACGGRAGVACVLQWQPPAEMDNADVEVDCPAPDVETYEVTLH